MYPGVDTSDSRDGPNLPFTLLKKADVELLVFSSHQLITPLRLF